MVKKEVQELYREAIFHHLIREGFRPSRAEVESRRRMMRDDVL